MPLLLAVAVVLALVGFWFWRSRRTEGEIVVDHRECSLDAWVLSDLATLVRDRLPAGIDEKRVEKSLSGDPDPEVVSALEDVVSSVEIEFLKDALDGRFDVVLRVRLDDGSERVQRTRRTLADLPARVRDDFEKKALTRARLGWGFPWARANEKNAFH